MTEDDNPDGSPILSVEGFEGPLDWLLERVRARRIDVARLSLVGLVDAFVAALDSALKRRGQGRAAPLGRWADWLVMAATLALLRSNLLQPAAAGEDDPARRQAETLRRLLRSRAEMAEAAAWLDARTQLGRDVFARGVSDLPVQGHVGGDRVALLRACLSALRLPDALLEQAYRPVPPPVWGPEQAARRLRALLPVLPAQSPITAFLPVVPQGPRHALSCRAAVASTLVAALELTRQGEIGLAQQGAFTNIAVSAGSDQQPV